MKLLLTSGGVSNESIQAALVELLGKPVSECSALFVPTAIYPFPGGAQKAWQALTGAARPPLCGLGWRSLGILELTALPSIKRESWVPDLQEADALLVWGGDVLYLRERMQESGLADLLPSLEDLTYVGVSAGSIVMTAYNCDVEFDLQYVSPRVAPPEDPERGLGFVDFALRVHLDHEGFDDSSTEEVERWADQIPVPTYAIDDQSAVVVRDGVAQVVSEGHWRLIEP